MAYYTCVKNNPSSKAASFAERTEQLVNGSDKRNVLEVKNGVPHEINTGRSMSELSVCPHAAGVHCLYMCSRGTAVIHHPLKLQMAHDKRCDQALSTRVFGESAVVSSPVSQAQLKRAKTAHAEFVRCRR